MVDDKRQHRILTLQLAEHSHSQGCWASALKNCWLLPCLCVYVFNKGHEKHTRQQHRYICSNAQLHFGKEDRQHMRMHITMGWHKLSPSQAEENWKVGVTGRRWKIGPTYCVTKSTTDKMTITACYWSNWVKQKWILMSHIF